MLGDSIRLKQITYFNNIRCKLLPSVQRNNRRLCFCRSVSLILLKGTGKCSCTSMVNDLPPHPWEQVRMCTPSPPWEQVRMCNPFPPLGPAKNEYPFPPLGTDHNSYTRPPNTCRRVLRILRECIILTF